MTVFQVFGVAIPFCNGPLLSTNLFRLYRSFQWELLVSWWLLIKWTNECIHPQIKRTDMSLWPMLSLWRWRHVSKDATFLFVYFSVNYVHSIVNKIIINCTLRDLYNETKYLTIKHGRMIGMCCHLAVVT